jgi:hypothetical protein
MVALVAGGTAAAITTATAATGTGTISGTVSDPGGYPVAGATIKVSAYGGASAGTATTDGAGRFSLSGLATDGDDLYRYKVTDPSGRHLADYSTPVAVKDDATTYSNLSLKAAGIIQGKVYTKDGTGPLLAGKNVMVTADQSRDGGPNGSIMVSPKGGFRLGGLPTGTYYVSFYDKTEVFDETCYDNIRRTQQGCVGITKVRVTAGTTTTLPHRQVMTHKFGSFSGTVTDTAGQPLQGMKVEVHTTSSPDDVAIPVTTGADGSWRKGGFDFVGQVRIKVSDPSGAHRTTWYVNAVSYATATPVTMKDEAQVKNLDIVLPNN